MIFLTVHVSWNGGEGKMHGKVKIHSNNTIDQKKVVSLQAEISKMKHIEEMGNGGGIQ